MDLPARFVEANVIWSRDGARWATFELVPASYTYLSAADKTGLLQRVAAAMGALERSSLWLSVCRPTTPGEVVDAMVAGVDLAQRPAWARLAEATWQGLDGLDLFARHHYVAVRLAGEEAGVGWRQALAAAANQVGTAFGLGASVPTDKERARARARAAEITERLAGHLEVRPASWATIRWLYERATRRGIGGAVWPGPAPSQDTNGVLGAPQLASLSEAVVFEGGTRKDPDRPAHRRYVRVDTEAGSSFQTFLCVADLPGRWVFPGGAGEWFARADQAPFPVDWAARITPVANAAAQHEATKQARQLAAQVGEYEGEPAGVPATLGQAMADLDEERAALAAEPATPELVTTIVFSVAAGGLAELERRASGLRQLYEATGYHLPRPTGGQTELLRAMLPGAATPSVARDYRQHLLPTGLASGMPVAASAVGEDTGMLLGFSTDGGACTPVFVDPAAGPDRDTSGSLVVSGALGAGKSYAVKRLAWAALARGGQVVALDRTAAGEYVAFAKAAPGSVQVVQLTDAAVCLDPLAVFTGTDAATRATLGFLTLLTGASPVSDEGATLREATSAVAEAGGRLADVALELEALAETRPAAGPLSRRLSTLAGTDLASVAFSRGRPVQLDADLVVFHAPGFELPAREALADSGLGSQLLPEQVVSVALLYLVAATARQIAFTDLTRFGAVVFDEAWALTASAHGRQLLSEIARDGRKHAAALWLCSQHPSDVGDGLGDLIPRRLIFRLARPAAATALDELGLEDPNGQLATTVAGFDTGQCLLRDLAGRIGGVQVAAAPGWLDEAFQTTPGRAAAPEAQGSRR